MTIWDKIYRDYQSGGPAWASLKEGLNPSFIEFIEQNDFAIKNALDIGCGDGRYLLFLMNKGFTITGLDSSSAAVSMATKDAEQSGQFIVADMYDYQYQTMTYDLVISHAALHHDLKAKVVSLVEKIHSLLVVNGRIFLSLPNDDCKTNWAMMDGHETLPDGTCIPMQGPEKGLPHSFFSRQEIDTLFRRKYGDLAIKLDDRGRWIITGQKRA
ncbi:MAG: class I SAM-dependent methyltransferase [Anaerolineales bacterium]